MSEKLHVVQFPEQRALCHWCGAARKEVVTLVLPPSWSRRYRRTTLEICNFCVESWAFWAMDAERKRRRRFR